MGRAMIKKSVINLFLSISIASFSMLCGCIHQAPQPTSLVVEETPSPTPVIESGYDEGVIKKSAKLRKEPSKKSTVLKILPAGFKIKVIEKTNDWYNVLCDDGTNAYVHESLIKIQSINKPKVLSDSQKSAEALPSSGHHTHNPTYFYRGC